MKKIKIKPHKGGRDKMISVRLTSEEKALIDKVRKKMSYADYLVDKARADLEEFPNRINRI